MTLPNELTVFRWGMPAEYSQVFDYVEINEHFGIFQRRAQRVVHAELWRQFARDYSVVCVTAADYPGLLTAVTTAFALHRLSISSAQVYSHRDSTGELQAFDLFWLQRCDNKRKDRRPPTTEQVEGSLRTLTGFVRAGAIPPEYHMVSLPRFPLPPARVFFRADQEGGHELVIEAFDGPGLMTHIARTLFELDLSIVSSDIRTQNGTVTDRFVLSPTGDEPLGAAARKEICRALGKSMEKWRQRHALKVGA